MATTERVTGDTVTCDRCGGVTPEAAACWEMATPVCPPCFLAGQPDRDAVRCDVCGGPCDAGDAVTDSSGTVTLCGGFYGNGCDRFLPAVESGQDVAAAAGFTYRDVTVEQHAADGFTLWFADPALPGYLCHERFVGWSVRDAVARTVDKANRLVGR